ncbi:MAG: mannose-1-phosphate guanylyltransferase [Treponema sp.]|jgi:mannose-1-phosphate guanylyltransferase/mannose-6-phosphate isomerase|nr:mannose-1-phosphate guanylyltransferase [Treponema sp.]
MFNDCIIMAGGSGTRLWPASNSKTPKQFLSVTGEGSLFNDAVDRALALTGKDGRVIIIAGKTHVPHIIRVCEKYGGDDKKRLVLIPEPLAKNTAPAIACGAFYAEGAGKEDRNVMVLTSDHIIRPLRVFTADAAATAAFSARGNLVIFGIPPRGPETGYGYIETGDQLAGPDTGETAVYKVLSFREKPSQERAEQFLAAGNYYWNSGMFCFSSRFILEEFRRNAPEIYSAFGKLTPPGEAAYTVQGGIRVLDKWPGLEEAYNATPGISVDYAIAEKCSRTVVVSARFEWFDVGSWDEYVRLASERRPGDASAEVYVQDSSGCFVDSDIPAALCGVDDLIVVIRSGRDGAPASALIVKKGAAQGVKNIVEQIKAAGRTELL